MIRFKVVRASHLLLTVAIIVLIAALILMGTRLLAPTQSEPANRAANLVDAKTGADGAKAEHVFAPSDRHGDSLLQSSAHGLQIDIVSAGDAQISPQRVLIYHTHTHEAYEQIADDPYPALEAWRTKDAGHSVVRVGEALAERLRGYGFEVVHDATDHEGTQLSTAYSRSLQTLLSYKEQFDLYIDLHRDAYVDGEPVTASTQQSDEMAPLLLLIGNGNGFDTKPWFDQNYRFACSLTDRINDIVPGLCKPVLVKDGRYNQHIGVFSVLVEVGHNRNTLTQALNAVSPLAEAIHSLMVSSPDPILTHMKRQWEKTHSPIEDQATIVNPSVQLKLDPVLP